MNVEQFQAFVKHGNFTKDERDSKFLAAMGLAGEAGEVCDLLKKHLLHGKELDRDELNKELGDVLWYLFHAFNAWTAALRSTGGKRTRKNKTLKFEQGAPMC
jgi:NTP pyrophosphatase (non-canonical NTP hydrolase)